jgi:hypothetical protein
MGGLSLTRLGSSAQHKHKKEHHMMDPNLFEQQLKEIALKERERIIAYLIEKDVLREAMFYPGYVAMNTSGTTGIDLSITLGADE